MCTATHRTTLILQSSSIVDAAPITLPSYSFYGGSLVGQVIGRVSYGRITTQATTGSKVVDIVSNDTQGVGQTYLFDFDGPKLSANPMGTSMSAIGSLGTNIEASLISGDSGSAVFVQVIGCGQLASTNTFAISFAQRTTIQGAYGTVVVASSWPGTKLGFRASLPLFQSSKCVTYAGWPAGRELLCRFKCQ